MLHVNCSCDKSLRPVPSCKLFRGLVARTSPLLCADLKSWGIWSLLLLDDVPELFTSSDEDLRELAGKNCGRDKRVANVVVSLNPLLSSKLSKLPHVGIRLGRQKGFLFQCSLAKNFFSKVSSYPKSNQSLKSLMSRSLVHSPGCVITCLIHPLL